MNKECYGVIHINRICEIPLRSLASGDSLQQRQRNK